MRGFCTPQASHNVTLATHGNDAPQSLHLRNRTAALCVLETDSARCSCGDVALVAPGAGGVGVDSARGASVTAGGCGDVTLVAPGAGGVDALEAREAPGAHCGGVPKDEREGFGLPVAAAAASLREAPGALTVTSRTSQKNSLPSLTTIS